MKLVLFSIAILTFAFSLGEAPVFAQESGRSEAAPSAAAAGAGNNAAKEAKPVATPKTPEEAAAAKRDAGTASTAGRPRDKGAQPSEAATAATGTDQAAETRGAPENFSITSEGAAVGELQSSAAPPPAAGLQQPDAGAAVPGIYTVHSNAEVGWRFLGTSGNFDQYQSDLNYDRGIRLMSADFVAKSQNGAGALFDNILVDMFGWGGDPTEYAHVQVEKQGWYRFDGSYRRIDYFNDLANFALGQHLADTQYQIGDYDLTLFPQNRRFKAYLGYSEDRNQGTSTITYDYSRNEFPIEAPVRYSSDEYRLGFDAKLWVFDISFMQGLRYFKDDTTYQINSFEAGNGAPGSSINSLTRDMPTRGYTPYTRLNLHTQIKKKLDVTGRIIYSDSDTNFTFFESVVGNTAAGAHIDPDVTTVSGNAKRPDWIADFGITLFATDALTISDTLTYNNFRITGGNNYLESLSEFTSGGAPLPAVLTETLSLSIVDYKELKNTIEADYRFTKWLSAHGGYRYTNRNYELGSVTTPPPSSLTLERANNDTNSGFVGFRLRPVTPWTLYFDFERGQADNVFVRVANYDYTNVRLRNMIRVNKNMTINASLVTKDNDNPAVISAINPQPFGVNIISRIFSGSLDWTPTPKLYLSGGYTYDRLDSNAAIILFFSEKETIGSSLYFMRDNFFFVNARVQLHPRVSLYAGIRMNKDPGQGDRVASSPSEIISSYPLRFSTPEARLTVTANRHVDFNAGWQYYSYVEKLSTAQNFSAQLAYVSVTLKFSRE
jgi:hypothetical protein